MPGWTAKGSGRARRARVAYIALAFAFFFARVVGELFGEIRFQDLPCCRRGRFCAETAFLHRNEGDDTRIWIGSEDAVPRLVEMGRALGRAGLAGDRDREIAKDFERGPAAVLRGVVQAFQDRGPVFRVDVEVALWLG